MREIYWAQRKSGRGVVWSQSLRYNRIVRGAATLLAVSFVFALLHVWTRVLVVQTGYRIRTLMEEQEILKGESHTLKLEVATLRSPMHLERVASKLGLRKPAEKRVTLISSRAP